MGALQLPSRGHDRLGSGGLEPSIDPILSILVRFMVLVAAGRESVTDYVLTAAPLGLWLWPRRCWSSGQSRADLQVRQALRESRRSRSSQHMAGRCGRRRRARTCPRAPPHCSLCTDSRAHRSDGCTGASGFGWPVTARSRSRDVQRRGDGDQRPLPRDPARLMVGTAHAPPASRGLPATRSWTTTLSMRACWSRWPGCAPGTPSALAGSGQPRRWCGAYPGSPDHPGRGPSALAPFRRPASTVEPWR